MIMIDGDDDNDDDGDMMTMITMMMMIWRWWWYDDDDDEDGCGDNDDYDDNDDYYKIITMMIPMTCFALIDWKYVSSVSSTNYGLFVGIWKRRVQGRMVQQSFKLDFFAFY